MHKNYFVCVCFTGDRAEPLKRPSSWNQIYNFAPNLEMSPWNPFTRFIFP